MSALRLRVQLAVDAEAAGDPLRPPETDEEPWYPDKPVYRPPFWSLALGCLLWVGIFAGAAFILSRVLR